MSVRPDLSVITHDSSQWAAEAAALVLDLRNRAIAKHGRFLVALSGGKTPEQLYRRLDSTPTSRTHEWDDTHFFFSDERCVPPDDPESNFHLADQALFRPLKIREDRIYRMKGEHPNPDAAARDYETVLRTATTASTGWPEIDLVLLGVGNDGHTASLFPGTDAVQENDRAVTVGCAPSPPRNRLTLTLGVINHASVVLFLASGDSKAAILQRILEPRQQADRQLPAALVRPRRGRLIWLLDRPAAANLTGHSQEDRPRHP